MQDTKIERAEEQGIILAREQGIAKMFNLIASRYDFLNALLSAGQDKRWRKKMVALAPIKKGGWWLDVACGTGDVLLEAQAQHSEYSKWTGVDISHAMLSLAQEKSKAAKAAINFFMMSAQHLELEAESVDCLSISFGLRNVIDKEAALKEFHRVIKPKGCLLILEFFPPKTSIISRFFLFYFRHILPRVGGLFSDKAAYKYLPDSVASFYSHEELTQKLTTLGFNSIHRVSFLLGNCQIVRAYKI